MQPDGHAGSWPAVVCHFRDSEIEVFEDRPALFILRRVIAARCAKETTASMSALPDRSARQAREAGWQALMRAAQDGDRTAYSRLLSELLPVLRAVVGRKWRERQDVEDIVQDILLSLHAVRHTYDPSRPFMPWLMTITRRRIADLARTRASRSDHETLVETLPETFEDVLAKTSQEHSEDREAVKTAIATLPEGQREAIELVKLKELSLQEASQISGKSVVSLKVSVHRALKAMRAQLERKSS